MAKKKPIKSAKDVDQKAKHTALLRKLEPVAKKINVRLEKAAGLDDKAYDHRLAAAIELDGAKKQCETAKINFKKWCEDNVSQSYGTVKKLAQVGGADDPAKALEDLRHKNKQRNQKLRDSKKAAAPGSGGGGGGASRDTSAPSERSTPAGRILEAFDVIPDDQGLNLLKSQAENYGMKVVAASEVSPNVSKVDTIKKAFNLLAPKMKTALVKQLAKSIGMTVGSQFDQVKHDSSNEIVKGNGVDPVADPLDIPKNLQRKATRRSRTEKAAEAAAA